MGSCKTRGDFGGVDGPCDFDQTELAERKSGDFLSISSFQRASHLMSWRPESMRKRNNNSEQVDDNLGSARSKYVYYHYFFFYSLTYSQSFEW